VAWSKVNCYSGAQRGASPTVDETQKPPSAGPFPNGSDGPRWSRGREVAVQQPTTGSRLVLAAPLEPAWSSPGPATPLPAKDGGPWTAVALVEEGPGPMPLFQAPPWSYRPGPASRSAPSPSRQRCNRQFQRHLRPPREQLWPPLSS